MTQSQRLRSGNVQPPASTMSVYEAIHSRRMNNEFTDDVPPREIVTAHDWTPQSGRQTIVSPTPGDSSCWRKAEPSGPRWPSSPMTIRWPAAETRTQPTAAVKGCLDAARVDLRLQRAWRPGRHYAGKLRRCLLRGSESACLAAVAEGLAGDWSTGNTTRHPRLAETLGGEADWMMVGALFIGQPSRPSASVRAAPAEVAVWLD